MQAIKRRNHRASSCFQRSRILPVLATACMFVLPCTPPAPAAANYQVWSGNEDLLEIEGAYYNVDEHGYLKLGQASGVATFYGDYQYYVVAVTNLLHLDAVQGSDGYFYGEQGDAHLVTGNVLNWNNVVGPTNDQYAVLGGDGSENFTSYFRFTNPGTWTSITVYALSESPLNSHFSVDPNFNSLWGHDDWPAGETLTITVGDPVEFEGHASVNEWGDWNLWEIPHDIQAGDLVRVECGEIVREHVVREVQVVSVDPDANTVSGTAATGTWVNVSIYDSDVSRYVETGPDGSWLADFSVKGEEEWEVIYNIETDTRGCACQFDEEGNATHITWRLPDPVMRVNLLRNYVRGEGWPSGAVIEMTVGDPGDPYISATVQADRNGYWWFDPDEDHRIQVGDVITADDGTYERSMTVAGLSVTGADTGDDTLSGTGPSNAWVLVRVGEVTMEAEANHDGEWTADLGEEGIAVEEGTDGYVYFYDGNGNATYIFWRYHTLDVEEIALIWVQWEDLYHFFVLEILGEGILGARVRTPSEQWYALQPDDWEMERWEYGEHDESIEALDTKYPPGEYLVEITHYHGVSTAIVDFAETPEMPNAMPEIVSPTLGQSDVGTPEANLEWASVGDPNFGIIQAFCWEELSDNGDEHEELIFFDPGDPFPASVTMTDLQPDRVYGCEVIFINAEEENTTGEVETEYLLLRAKVTESLFSTNTDPDRFDPIERVDIGRYVIEADGGDPVHVFSFETYFTDSVASLFHEIILRSADGDDHHLHHTGISPVHDDEILFEIEADDPDDLPGDGWYVLVLCPDPETAVCTPFWFGDADQVSPLPMPTQQPVITAPSPDALLASPVLITWEELAAPDVNTLAVIPADDEDPVILENLAQTTYGPIEKEAGEHLAGVIFAHGMGELENDDGILFGGNKLRGTLHTYTVGHTLTYIAGAGGWIEGPTNQLVRPGEDAEEVVATPEPGAMLAHWCDGLETTSRQDTQVTDDITAAAYFASEGGVPIDWYVDHDLEPEAEEDWSDMDLRYDPEKRMTLVQQFVADLNPTNPASVFQISSIEPGPPITVRFVPASTGRVYSFEATDNLASGIWSNVPGAEPRFGQGGEDAFTDTNTPASGPYYRMQVKLPNSE